MGNRVAIRMNKRPLKSGAEAPHSKTQTPEMAAGIDGQGAYDQTAIPVESGDFLLFYTDGLIEMRNAHDEPLGERGLLEIVRSLDLMRSPQAAQALGARLEAFRDGRSVDDDQTFLLLRHSPGLPRRISLREKIDVYAKVFRLKNV